MAPLGHNELNQWIMAIMFYFIFQSNNGFALIVRAKDCQIMYASHTITDKFGHFLVDIIGTHASSIIHPSDVNILEKQFDRNGGKY